MFHRLIEPEDKERLSRIIELIQNSLESEGYTPTERHSGGVLMDLSGTPIKGIRFYISKENISYKIAIQMLGS